MPSDFPFLDALADEIHKIHFETEEQAKQLINRDIAELRMRKDEAFSLARGRIASHTEAVTNMGKSLNRVIDKLSNSGDKINPTVQNSSDNSKT